MIIHMHRLQSMENALRWQQKEHDLVSLTIALCAASVQHTLMTLRKRSL